MLSLITRNSVSPILQNLVLPISDTPNCVQKSVPKARLLTSGRCMAELDRGKATNCGKKKLEKERGLRDLRN